MELDGRIYLIRGHRVMLDSDLAELYGVPTRQINQQVRRNRRRFPQDFVFLLTSEEVEILRSQNVISSWGGRRYPPFAFTEHGAVMLANVLNSTTAIDASVQVVRAFLRLRAMLSSHAELARKVQELESKYDGQFRVVFDALRELMEDHEEEDKGKIGFRSS